MMMNTTSSHSLLVILSLAYSLIGLTDAVVTHSATDGLDSCMADYPNQYEVFKLKQGETILVDGKLDEDAWNEAPWSESFKDIEGIIKPLPRFETKVKMRYDDDCLWVGAYLEEPQAWANITVTNSVIYEDNDFEIFLDPDGNTHYYKELEINAYGKQWNLLMVRPYLNGGPAVCNRIIPTQCSLNDPEHGVGSTWDITSDLQIGVSVNGGTLNDPRQGSTDWTLEICLPLNDYARYEEGVNVPPRDGDYWRINFSRVQYMVNVHIQEDGTQVYWKDLDSPADNWVFQPMGVVNIHQPERWGYIRFSEAEAVSNAGTISQQDPTWPVRHALAQVYESLKIYDYLYGLLVKYTDSLPSLVANGHLSQDVADGKCAGIPKVILSEDGSTFEVQVGSLSDSTLIGHIDSDRRTWFTRG